MSGLFNPFAFSALGVPEPQKAPPALRVMGGDTLTPEQHKLAQQTFHRFCENARLSAVPHPAEMGQLPDGSAYKITDLAGHRVMQVWAGGFGGSGEDSDYLNCLPPSNPDSAISGPPRKQHGWHAERTSETVITEQFSIYTSRTDSGGIITATDYIGPFSADIARGFRFTRDTTTLRVYVDGSYFGGITSVVTTAPALDHSVFDLDNHGSKHYVINVNQVVTGTDIVKNVGGYWRIRQPPSYSYTHAAPPVLVWAIWSGGELVDLPPQPPETYEPWGVVQAAAEAVDAMNQAEAAAAEAIEAPLREELSQLWQEYRELQQMECSREYISRRNRYESWLKNFRAKPYVTDLTAIP